MTIRQSIVILLVALTATGCFTNSLLTDGLVPDDRAVRFHLTDGTMVVSTSGMHHRVEGGYQVTGLRMKDKANDEKYEGVLPDREIDHVTVQKFNTVGTIALVGGFTALVLLLVEVSKLLSFSRML